MSYTQNFSGSVPYSGSVSYSYPASQSGGSGRASYSGNIPVTVTVFVNTDPFDGSVSRFNASIGALGVSVSAMHLAQCAAIQKTAKDVSASLINGFFGTINTELSQQLQALDSAVKASFGLIQQQGKAVSDKKNTMENDYNRISSRYIKLFADLDNECYKRINALDKQSFSLSEKVQKQLLCESSGDTAALNLLGIEEVSSSKTLVFVSSLNRKTVEVLKTLHDYIIQEYSVNELMDSFLLNEETDEQISILIPVIWSESDMLENRNVNQECFVPGQIVQGGKQDITEKVGKFCCGDPSLWKVLEDGEKEALNREFNSLSESCFAGATGETEQRIYETMLSLWQNAQTFTL